MLIAILIGGVIVACLALVASALDDATGIPIKSNYLLSDEPDLNHTASGAHEHAAAEQKPRHSPPGTSANDEEEPEQVFARRRGGAR
jgi:hypothetical protein